MMISRARWQKIQALFDETVDVGPDERAHRLAREEDPLVREEWTRGVPETAAALAQ